MHESAARAGRLHHCLVQGALRAAAQAGVQARVTAYALREADQALQDLRDGHVRAAPVLVMRRQVVDADQSAASARGASLLP
jgi:hypothetical protein